MVLSLIKMITVKMKIYKTSTISGPSKGPLKDLIQEFVACENVR